MPRYLMEHALACLTRQGAEAVEGWLKTEGMHFDFLVRIE